MALHLYSIQGSFHMVYTSAKASLHCSEQKCSITLISQAHVVSVSTIAASWQCPVRRQLKSVSHTLQDRRTVSRSRSPSRSRSRSYSRSRSRSYSRSPSRSRLRSASPRRYNRSVTPPPRRTFGPRPHQHPSAPAPVHGIPPPGSGPAPPQAPPQPYGVLPPVSSFPPSSGAFGHMAPNPLAGMFQPLPAAPPTNPMLVNQQVRTTAVSLPVLSLHHQPCWIGLY
jgi:hypothetical protein